MLLVLILMINHVYLAAMIPPLKFLTTDVITTTPYSAEISWVTPYIISDTETFLVQYSTDTSLEHASEVAIEASNEFVFNQKFSVNITGLIPFTTYYYIIQANNSAGITITDVMTFTTNQTGMNTIIIHSTYCIDVIAYTAPSVAPSNFQAANITSTSITFSWDALVDQANGIIQLYVITCTTDNIVIMVSLMNSYINVLAT